MEKNNEYKERKISNDKRSSFKKKRNAFSFNQKFSPALKQYSKHTSNLLYKDKDLIVRACQTKIQKLHPEAIFVYQTLNLCTKDTLLHLHSILSGYGLKTKQDFQMSNCFTSSIFNEDIEHDKRQALENYRMGKYFSIIHRSFQCPRCFQPATKGYSIHSCERDQSKLCEICFQECKEMTKCYFCHEPDPNARLSSYSFFSSEPTSYEYRNVETKNAEITLKDHEEEEEGEIVSKLSIQSPSFSATDLSSMTQEKEYEEDITHLNLGKIEEVSQSPFREDEF